MKRLLFTAFVAVFLWGCGGDDPPVAETPVAAAPACPPYQLPEQELRTLWAAMEWHQINTDYVDAIEHFVNQQPPPTDWDAVRAYVVSKGQVAALVLVMDDGCAWTTGPQRAEAIAVLIRQATGEGA
jgi:hypothetical protein